jgi:hypothetical protein
MIRSAWVRYAVLLVGLGLVLITAVWSVWPWPYVSVVERFILPQYEERLGFRGGRVVVTWGQEPFTVYGFVSVQSGGVMGRAGVKAGDIPIDYHSGVGAFYHAVQEFDAGVRGEFDVLAQPEWRDWSRRRRIVLVPDAPRRAP